MAAPADPEPEPAARSGAGAGAMPTLARCVGDVALFEQRHWGRAPLHRAARADPALRRLLTVDDVDSIVSSAARWPAVRMVASGSPTAPSEYCSPTRIGSQDVERVVDARKIVDRYRRGSTLVLQSLHRTWPRVSRFTADLEAEIGHTVQANAYLSPPSAAGLAPHADTHDVIVVQLHGAKRWEIDGLAPIRLVEGDTAYIPRGTRHCAHTTDSPSLHLTIGIHRATFETVARRALARIGPELSASLPLGYRDRPGALADAVQAALAAAAERLAATDPAPLVAELGRRAVRADTGGLLRDAVTRPPVTADTDVAIAAGVAPVTITPLGAERIRLAWSSGALRLPASTAAAVRRLTATEPGRTRVGDLPDLDPSGRIVLVRRLLDEGLLVPL